jgi:hypothetical protein
MCVLRVSGKKFDPARFLASSRLKPYSVFRVGEPRFASQPKGETHDVSGFKVDVSRRSWDNLAGQVADAIAFLKKHTQTLAKLRSIPEVEDIRLDFPLLDLRIDREKVFAQFDYFPPALVSLAGALHCGLEMSIYPRDLEQLARSRRKSSRKRSGTSRRKRR